ncbi:hypothetical protein D3C76_1873900 [compost metagenome]
MHDEAVAIPALHTGQVQPFIRAGQADVLLVNADLLAKAQGHLAAIEHVQFVGAGAACQFVADCSR